MLLRAVVNRSPTRRVVGYENAADDSAVIEVDAARRLRREKERRRRRSRKCLISNAPIDFRV